MTLVSSNWPIGGHGGAADMSAVVWPHLGKEMRWDLHLGFCDTVDLWVSGVLFSNNSPDRESVQGQIAIVV